MSIELAIFAVFVLSMLMGSVYLIKYKNGFYWFLSSFRKILTYSGRAKRIEYISYAVIGTTIYLLLTLIYGMLADAPKFMVYILNFGYSLIMLTLTTRRLHDLGFSGWLQVPFVIIEIYSPTTGIQFIILNLVLFSFMAFLATKEGQGTANNYGNVPA